MAHNFAHVDLHAFEDKKELTSDQQKIFEKIVASIFEQQPNFDHAIIRKYIQHMILDDELYT